MKAAGSRVFTSGIMACAGGVVYMVSSAVLAQSPRPAPADAGRYPTRVVRLLVGYVAGGAVDVSARIISQKMAEPLGQAMIVDNRPGADGNLAADIVSKSPPDGYSLVYVSAGHTMNPAMYPKSLPYNPVKDFAPVSMLALGPQVLVVNPSLPAHNVKELVALAKAKPGTINFGSSGSGGPMHLSGELLKSVAGIDIVHVPYKGGGQAVNDLIAGQIEMTFVGAPAVLPSIKSGRVRVLAVSTIKRSAVLPDVPTVAESGYPGFDIPASYSVLAPAGTPGPVVQKLYTEFARVMAQPEMRQRLASFGVEPLANTPEQLTAFMTADVAKWAKLIQSIGLKTE